MVSGKLWPSLLSVALATFLYIQMQPGASLQRTEGLDESSTEHLTDNTPARSKILLAESTECNPRVSVCDEK